MSNSPNKYHLFSPNTLWYQIAISSPGKFPQYIKKVKLYFVVRNCSLQSLKIIQKILSIFYVGIACQCQVYQVQPIVVSFYIYCNTIHPYKVTSLRSFSEANTDRYENRESIEVVFASYYISKKQVWLTKTESF